jgi:hypothetical protein
MNPRVTVPIAPARGHRRSATIHVPAAATLDFVEPIADVLSCPTVGSVARSTRMGLWDHAWNRSTGEFQNIFDEYFNFVGADSRRFYLRVRDASARGGRVLVRWRTRFQSNEHTPGVVHDNGNGEDTLILRRINRDTFVSPGLMIVNNRMDAEVPTHDAVSEHDLRSRGTPDMRTREATLFDFVEAEYPVGQVAARVPVFLQEERKRITVQIHVVDHADIDATLHQIWHRDLRVVREVYGRIGIWVATARSSATEGRDVVQGTDVLRVVSPSREWNRMTRSTPVDGNVLKQAFPRLFEHIGLHTHSGGDIRVFYSAVDFANRVRGETWAHDYNTRMSEMARRSAIPQDPNPVDLRLLGTIALAATRTPYTLAHEIGHVLLDPSHRSPTGTVVRDTHFVGDDQAHNILRAGSSEYEAYNSACRINEEQFSRIVGNLRVVHALEAP